jgi:putative phage-type endonuclease
MTTQVIEAGQQVTPDARGAWLERRRGSVGASEVAAMMGADPYRSSWAVWLSKVEPVDAEEETPEACWWGLRDEPNILERYTIATGRTIEAAQVWTPHPTLPLAATLDAIDDLGQIVEAKSTTRLGALGDEGSDDLPFGWLLQAQAQLMCRPTAPCVVFAVRVGHQLRTFRVDADATVQARIAEEVASFWRCVQERVEPDLAPGDLRAYSHRVPVIEGETVEADAEVETAVRSYEELAPVIKEYQALRDQHKAAIIQRLAGRAARLEDGRVVRRQDVQVKERVQTVAAHTQVRVVIAKGGAK